MTGHDNMIYWILDFVLKGLSFSFGRRPSISLRYDSDVYECLCYVAVGLWIVGDGRRRKYLVVWLNDL